MTEAIEDKNNIKENKENKEIKTDKNIKKEKFGDLTSIIKSKIKKKALLKNKYIDNRNKSYKSEKKKNYSALLTFNHPKRKERSLENLHKNSSIHTSSTAKDSTKTVESSYKIKKKKKINPELFINKKKPKNKIENTNKNGNETAVKPKKKFNFNIMLNRF